MADAFFAKSTRAAWLNTLHYGYGMARTCRVGGKFTLMAGTPNSYYDDAAVFPM